MSGEIVNAGRTLEQVTNGILMLSGQLVANACQIGKLLVEAKEMVGHGGWVEYVEQKISYSQSTANNFMRLYEEYGEFGPNSQTIANFGPTKALALLALPAEQREQFAEEHKDDSVRQLKAEIAKLTRRAEKTADDLRANQELLMVATEENGALKQRLEGIDADYKEQLSQLGEKNAELLDKLAVAENREPVISPEEQARLRKEGADEQAALDRQKLAESERKALDTFAVKDARIAELEGLLEKAQKSAPAGAANPNYGAFKASFEALVPAFQQVCKYAVAAADTPEQVTANRNAVKGLLIKLGGLADREISVV